MPKFFVTGKTEQPLSLGLMTKTAKEAVRRFWQAYPLYKPTSVQVLGEKGEVVEEMDIACFCESCRLAIFEDEEHLTTEDNGKICQACAIESRIVASEGE